MLAYLSAAGLLLALVLLVSIRARLAGLPFAVWLQASKAREAEAPKALDLMKEAVAAKAAVAVLSLQRHEEGVAAAYHALVADAQMRARVSERRAADTATALQAATALVRELREALEAARGPAAPPPIAEPSRSAGGLPSAVSEEDPVGEDERTRVGKRPCIPPPGDAETRSGGGAG